MYLGLGSCGNQANIFQGCLARRAIDLQKSWFVDGYSSGNIDVQDEAKENLEHPGVSHRGIWMNGMLRVEYSEVLGFLRKGK